MAAKRTVLVVGATGKQGRATVKYLLDPDAHESPGVKFKVQALTRDTSSESARQLLERNKQHADDVNLVQGDLDKPDIIRKIFQDASSSGHGIWGVFVALAYPGLGESAEGEIKQAKLIADLALEFKVEAFVYSSAIQVGGDADDALDNSHRAKPQIENYVKELGSKGLNWIILRPGFFMENFDGLIGAIAVSGLRAGLDKDATIDLIVSFEQILSVLGPSMRQLLQITDSLKASEDIGRCAAGALRQHDKYIHKTLTLSSEAATMEQISDSYKRATGRPIPAAPTLAGKALVKFNSALQNIVKEIKITHEARTSGRTKGMEAGIELARSVCKLRTYYEWKSDEKDGTADKNWNKVSLIKLITGRS